ncbi:MAG: TonB-dependent receptor [Mangrovibacterium sp.]
MRLVLVISLVSIMQTFALNAYTQNTKISLSVTEMRLEEIILRIESDTYYRFAYDKNEIDVDRNYSIDIQNAEVKELLNKLFSKGEINYTIVGRQIVLSPSESTVTLSQPKSVSGKVTDSSGSPLRGVTVIIKGTTEGTITDSNGNYSLSNVPENAALIFSFVGMRTQELSVSGRTSIDVSLTEETIRIEEVVAIGYGTQRRVNLTGSVSTVAPTEIQARPHQNVAALLQGKVPGLLISSNSGRPGREGVNILLRGMASYGTNNTPLVIIDGIPASLDMVNPEDVESVSVLKDAASASIYGSRATNGVILITTRKGKKGFNRLTYNGSYSVQDPTFLGDQIWNSAQYMKLFNQMVDRQGGWVKYSDEMIARYEDPHRDKIKYPDYNWMKGTFKSGSLMNHNLNFMGGSEKIVYNISLGYKDIDGITISDAFKKYTGLVSIESTINRWIKIGTNTKFLYSNTKESFYNDENGLSLLAGSSKPMYMPYLPDGSGRYGWLNIPNSEGGDWSNRNPIAMASETERKITNYIFNPQIYADITILNNNKITLTSHTQASFTFYEDFTNTYYPKAIPLYYYLKESDYKAGGDDEYKIGSADGWPADMGVSNNWNRSLYHSVFSTLDFNWNISENDHLAALVGYQEESSNSRSLSGKRTAYPHPGMKELAGGSDAGQSLWGNLNSELAMRSLFGRVKYSYKDRYLLEANLRADATSRLAPESRWGTFPSFSAAWKVSEENVIKNKLPWVNELKIRGSWGILGNSEVATYPYQETYSVDNYPFNGVANQALYNSAYKNRDLKWEETTVVDFGIDLALHNGLFGMMFDYYNKTTEGILATLKVPQSLGMNGPVVNYGSMRNRGVELQLSHKNTVGDFSYGLVFMSSLNKNKVLKLVSPSYGTYVYKEGLAYGEYYLYVWDGIFQSEDDIQNYATQPYANPKPGDIRYKDLNGDKKVDGDDRKVCKGVYPKIAYSGTINLAYKNFDLSAFFQGITGKRQLAFQWGVDPFTQGSPPSKKFLNAWTPTNKNTNVPAIYHSGYVPMNFMSTYYLLNSSYLRLKTLQIGYNLPESFLKKTKLQGLRIYLSGENLFTITNYGYGLDPENDQGKIDNVVKYPQLKSYSFGIRFSL